MAVRAPDGRLLFVDVAKGIGIVLVVYGHVVRGLQAAGQLPPGGLLGAVDYVIYAAHMPLFFLLSGLFFDREAAPGSFLIGRLRTIAYPYFLWSLLQGGVQIAAAGTGAVNGALPAAALWAIPWAPISPFWFLHALFIASLLLFALRRVNAAAVTGVALVVFLALQAGAGIEGTVNDIAYGFLYFSAGAMAARYGLLRLVPASMAGAAGLLLLYVGVALAARAAGVPERLPIPAAIAGILALVSLAKLIAANRRGADALGLLGACSLSIYVMHILAIGVARLVLLRLLGIGFAPLLIAGCTAAAVLGPVAVHLALVRLGANRLFGLPAPAPLRALVTRLPLASTARG